MDANVCANGSVYEGDFIEGQQHRQGKQRLQTRPLVLGHCRKVGEGEAFEPALQMMGSREEG